MGNCAGEMQIRPLMNDFTWHSLFFVLSVYCDCVYFFLENRESVALWPLFHDCVVFIYIENRLIHPLALSRWTVSVCLWSQLFCKHIPSFS